MIKPGGYRHRGAIHIMLRRAGFALQIARRYRLKTDDVMALYGPLSEELQQEPRGAEYWSNHVRYLTSGPSEIGLVTHGDGDAHLRLHEIKGRSPDGADCRAGTIRSKFPEGGRFNAFHCADTPAESRLLTERFKLAVPTAMLDGAIVRLDHGLVAVSRGSRRITSPLTRVALRMWCRLDRHGRRRRFAKHRATDPAPYLAALAETSFARTAVSQLGPTDLIVPVYQAEPWGDSEEAGQLAGAAAATLGLPSAAIELGGSHRLGAATADSDVDVMVSGRSLLRELRLAGLERSRRRAGRHHPAVRDAVILDKMQVFYDHIPKPTLRALVARSSWRRISVEGICYDLYPRYAPNEPWPAELAAIAEGSEHVGSFTGELVVESDEHGLYNPAGYECRGGIVLLGTTPLLTGTLVPGDRIEATGTVIDLTWDGEYRRAVLVVESDVLTLRRQP